MKYKEMVKYIGSLKSFCKDDYTNMVKKFGKEEVNNFLTLLVETLNDKDEFAISLRKDIFNILEGNIEIEQKSPNIDDIENMELEYEDLEKSDEYDFDAAKVSDIVKRYLLEMSRYPLLTAEQERKFAYDYRLKNQIDILTEKSVNSVSVNVLDLEKVFSSIDSIDTMNYVFDSIAKTYNNDGNKNVDSIHRYYIDEYKKLVNKFGRIPTKSELKKYFSRDNKYNLFTNFSSNKMISNDALKKQIDNYSKYAIAKNTLILCNLRLVIGVAKKYAGQGLDFIDLINEGNIGLMRGIDNFDVDMGFKLSTYSLYWIKQAITRSIANTGRTIRIPVHTTNEIRKFEVQSKKLEQKYGRSLSTEELANELGISVERISEFRKINILPTSLDVPIGDDDDNQLGDFIPDESESVEDTVINNDLSEMIRNILSGLNERDRQIIILRYGLDGDDPKTLEEIASVFGITRERIRQLERRTLKKLRVGRAKDLKIYMKK